MEKPKPADRPPILGTWRRFYVVVLVAHAVAIGLVRWLTVHFS